MPHKRRLLSLLLCFMLLCTGCSFSLEDWFPATSNSPVISTDRYTDEFSDSWSYRYLDDRLQLCYDAVYTALKDNFAKDKTVYLEQSESQGKIGIEIHLPKPLLSKEEGRLLFTAFFYDNPQFFYVHNTYGLQGYSKNGSPYYDRLVLQYTMGSEKRAKAREELNAAADAILAALPAGADEFEKELYLHDRLLESCRYDDNAAEEGYEKRPTAYTAYGALVEGVAVCEGYSRAMQLLLTQAGIPCTLVTGKAIDSEQSHMWNVVTVHGANYHLDPTWDDSGDQLRHNYFNITTKQLLLSHTLTEGQLGIDTCAATADSYYNRKGYYIDTYSRQTIAETIAQAIKNGETQAELLFAPDKYDNALLFLKKATLVREMVDACLAETGCTLWPYDLYSEAAEHILFLRKKEGTD